MPSVKIRKFQNSDIPRLIEVYSDAAKLKFSKGDSLWGEHPYSKEEIKLMVANRNFFVALINNLIVGSFELTDSDLRMWPVDGGAKNLAIYLHSLATSNYSRGAGIGKEILAWIEDYARSKGLKYIRLDCSRNNLALHNYYLKQGFQDVVKLDVKRKPTARDLRDPIYQSITMQKPL